MLTFCSISQPIKLDVGIHEYCVFIDAYGHDSDDFSVIDVSSNPAIERYLGSDGIVESLGDNKFAVYITSEKMTLIKLQYGDQFGGLLKLN